jgi:hypothetical protein
MNEFSNIKVGLLLTSRRQLFTKLTIIIKEPENTNHQSSQTKE